MAPSYLISFYVAIRVFILVLRGVVFSNAIEKMCELVEILFLRLISQIVQVKVVAWKFFIFFLKDKGIGRNFCRQFFPISQLPNFFSTWKWKDWFNENELHILLDSLQNTSIPISQSPSQLHSPKAFVLAFLRDNCLHKFKHTACIHANIEFFRHCLKKGIPRIQL